MFNWHTSMYVDDCCHVRDKYKSIFGNVEVQLDLFHACRRITSTTNKRSVLSLQFSTEFGLIFRQDEDQGNIRLKHTPDRVKIEEIWMHLLIDGLTLRMDLWQRRHFMLWKTWGYTSGREACGAEQNEYIHWILNWSLLVGSTSISVEFTIANNFFSYEYKENVQRCIWWCSSSSRSSCRVGNC